MSIPSSFCYFAISNLMPGRSYIRHVAFLRDLEYGPRRGKKTISTAEGFPDIYWIVSKLLHQCFPGFQSMGTRTQESNLSPFSFSFCSGINSSTPSSCLGYFLYVISFSSILWTNFPWHNLIFPALGFTLKGDQHKDRTDFIAGNKKHIYEVFIQNISPITFNI